MRGLAAAVPVLAAGALPGAAVFAGAALSVGVPSEARGPAAPLSLMPPNLRAGAAVLGVAAAAGLAGVGVLAATGLGAAGAVEGRGFKRGAVLGAGVVATSCCTPSAMAIACCFKLPADGVAAGVGVLTGLLPWPLSLSPSPSFGPLLGVDAACGAGEGVDVAAAAGEAWPWPLSFRKPDLGGPPAERAEEPCDAPLRDRPAGRGGPAGGARAAMAGPAPSTPAFERWSCPAALLAPLATF